MALPDQLADLERKVSVRFSAALAEMRQEMRRAVEAEAQRASSAMLHDLDAIRAPAAEKLLAEEDLLEMTREAGAEARRSLARSLRQSLVDFDGARSQSAVLEALLSSAQPFADHVALWLVRPTELVGWASRGFAGDPVAGRSLAHPASPALARLATGRGCVLLGANEAAELASALEMAAPARALFLPLVLRDKVAAALYLGAGSAGTFEIEALQMLTLAAAQRLELQALATRSYTPTLFLDHDAPANEGGLALWDPATSVSGAATADEVPAIVAAPTASLAPMAPMAPMDAWQESRDSAADADLAASETFATEPDAEETATLDDALPMVDTAFADSNEASLPEPAAAEISWQMEEADETALLGATPAASEAALDPVDPADTAAMATHAKPPQVEPPALTATPTHEIPISPPAAATIDRFAAAEWREVEETTAPHATVSSAVTQRFVAPASTNEFPQPALSSLPPSAASTIAFMPPTAALDAELAEDATVRIQRSSLQPLAAPPAAPPPPPSPPSDAVIEPARPLSTAVAPPDEEPTVSRGPRTTEVAPPADLQGPGWAFSSARSARATGDNALHEEARRLARLLVSEIKLYNEEQVEDGRHNRDIYHRLKDDIDRSRQIYEERVHESVRGNTDYFQQELVRSLAGGDPRALGI